MKPTLLVLAAGIGSRYGGLKQVDGIGPAGEAIIDYSVYDAIRAGFGKVVFVIRRSIEAAFKEKFAGKFDSQIAVDYIFQEIDSHVEGITDWPERQKPWGTGHAILMAAPAIQEPFAVINADDYYGVTAFQTLADFLLNECAPHLYAMVGYSLRNTLSENGAVSRGVCEIDDQHQLTNVVERTQIQRVADGSILYANENQQMQPISENAVVSMNLWGFHPSIFEHLHRQFLAFFEAHGQNPKSEFYIPFAVNDLIQEGRIRLTVLPTDEQWYGVTYQDDKTTVQEAFAQLTREGVYPVGLW